MHAVWLFMPYHHYVSHSPQLDLQSSKPHRAQTQLMLQLLLRATHRPHPPDWPTANNQLSAEQRDPANLYSFLLPTCLQQPPSERFPSQIQTNRPRTDAHQRADVSLAGLHLLCLKNKQTTSLLVLAWPSVMGACWERPESLVFADIQAQLLQDLF